MEIFIILNVYLLIRVVSLYNFSGVLSMRLNGGGKVELIIFIIGSYYLNIMTMMILIKNRR